MSNVVASSREHESSPSSGASTTSGSGSAAVQLKSGLVGHGYDVQRSMLTPVMRREPVAPPTPGREPAPTPAQGDGDPTVSAEGRTGAGPVQRRAIQRMVVQREGSGTPPAPAAPAAPGAPAAEAQQMVRKGNVPGAGDLEMLEANYNQACAAWIEQVAAESSAIVDATVELQRLYLFYEQKYKAGSWRHRIMSIFKTPPATPPASSIVDDAVTKALALQGGATSAARNREGASALQPLYEAAQMAHDAAWLSMEQYRTNIGEASGTFWKNAGMKVAIGIGGAIVGIGAGAAVAAAAPAVGIGVVTAKIATAMIGSGVGGAFSGAVKSGVTQYKQEGEVKAGQVVREAILQGSVGAAWSLLGGPLAALIGPLLPPPLQAKLGAKAGEYIMKGLNTGGGLALKGKIADAVRGKPDEAPFDANEIAYTVSQQLDLRALAADIEAAYAAEQAAAGGAPPAATPGR